MSSATLYWQKGTPLSALYTTSVKVGLSMGLHPGRTDQWTERFNQGQTNDTLTSKVRDYITVRWILTEQSSTFRIEFLWHALDRRDGLITRLTVVADTDIMACCLCDEAELNEPKLHKELVLYDFIKSFHELTQADVCCAVDGNGYEIRDFCPEKTPLELFEDYHCVYGRGGWQKLLRHLECRELLDCSARTMPPTFLYRHKETGEVIESNEMCPAGLTVAHERRL